MYRESQKNLEDDIGALNRDFWKNESSLKENKYVKN